MKLQYIATITAASILSLGGASLFAEPSVASTFANPQIVAQDPCAAGDEVEILEIEGTEEPGKGDEIPVNPGSSGDDIEVIEVDPCASIDDPCAAPVPVDPDAGVEEDPTLVDPCASPIE